VVSMVMDIIVVCICYGATVHVVTLGHVALGSMWKLYARY
jgi:hypothetical protein